MNKTPTIEIQQLILKGFRKDYIIPFNPGINIIYGDHATGKSTVLNLIDYMLGAKSFSPDHEIQSSVEYAILEVKLNDIPYVIKRDIYNPQKHIEVYLTDFENISNQYPVHCTINKNKVTENTQLYSDFLLSSLSLPDIKVKRSPSKAKSDMSKLSFRDIFKYCYIEQDDVGSTSFLDIKNPPVSVKNKETFKYIYNLLDENIAQLQEHVGQHSSLKNHLESKLKLVSEFLRETDFDSSQNLNFIMDNLEEEEHLLKQQFNNINKELSNSSEQTKALKIILKELNDSIKNKEQKIKISLNNVDQYTKLKNEYTNELSMIKASIEAKSLIGEVPEKLTNCPICESIIDLGSINQEFDIQPEDKLNQELLSIKRKVKIAERTVIEERDKIDSIKKQLSDLYEDKVKAEDMLNEDISSTVSPFISNRDGILKELSRISERKAKYIEYLKIRNKYDNIGREITREQNTIDKLQEKLNDLISNAPSMTETLSRIGSLFNKFLIDIGITNIDTLEISEKTLLPRINGKDYLNINSGGDRTITSIGYLLTLLIDSMNNELNLPRFLMVDTVGKYLGKTKYGLSSEGNINKNIFTTGSDADIYMNIYNYFIKQSELCEDMGLRRQIILVDNDVPPNIANDYLPFVIAHYSRDGVNGLPKGLIDDI